MINQLTIDGSLGADAESKTVGGAGQTLTTFNIANNRSYKVGDDWKEQTTWIQVNAWNQLGEKCEALRKGDRVLIQGRIEESKWQDKEGNNRSMIRLIADRVTKIKLLKMSEEVQTTQAPPPEKAGWTPDPNRPSPDLGGDEPESDGLPF